jgi:WD40 repeat protein
MSRVSLSLLLTTLLALCLLLSLRGTDPGLAGQRVPGSNQGREPEPPELPWRVFAVAFSPDGKTVAFGGDLGPVYLWDVQSRKQIRYLLTDNKYEILSNDDWSYRAWWVWSVAFSPDGKLLAAGDGGGIVQVWDLGSGKVIQHLEYPGPSSPSPTFARVGKHLAVGGGTEHDVVQLFDTTSGERVRVFWAPRRLGPPAQFTLDGQILAAAGYEEPTVWLWDAATGKEVRKLSCKQGRVESLAFSPADKFLATGGSDQTIRLWDVRTGKEMRRIETGQGDVNALAFSPDGKLLASGGGDGTVILWEMPSGKKVSRLGQPGRIVNVHRFGVTSLAFSSNGRILAAGRNTIEEHPRPLILWDVATGRMLWALERRPPEREGEEVRTMVVP